MHNGVGFLQLLVPRAEMALRCDLHCPLQAKVHLPPWAFVDAASLARPPPLPCPISRFPQEYFPGMLPYDSIPQKSLSQILPLEMQPETRAVSWGSLSDRM